MPIVRADETTTFNLPGLVFTSMAAPSRGSVQNSVWRVKLMPGTPGAEHSLDQEEIFVALGGKAVAVLDGVTFDVLPGDTLIVPARALFSLSNAGSEPFEAMAVAPAGVSATLATGAEPFRPPWTL
jgi:mannose-6-phosphate isomerase-like protein (cupin superfamily)